MPEKNHLIYRGKEYNYSGIFVRNHKPRVK